jgi:hypothetical protein
MMADRRCERRTIFGGDRRQETGDRRQETGDRRQESVHLRHPAKTLQAPIVILNGGSLRPK